MPKVPLTTSTRLQVAPSGGALPILYGTPLGPENWQSLELEASDWGLPPEKGFQWSSVDETPGGKVRFVTTIDIDAPTLAEVSLDAWRRMVCFYVIGHLSGEPLADACQSLADNYSWQIEQTRPIPQIPEQRRHAVSQVRRVERVPFAFDEE